MTDRDAELLAARVNLVREHVRTIGTPEHGTAWRRASDRLKLAEAELLKSEPPVHP